MKSLFYDYLTALVAGVFDDGNGGDSIHSITFVCCTFFSSFKIKL